MVLQGFTLQLSTFCSSPSTWCRMYDYWAMVSRIRTKINLIHVMFATSNVCKYVFVGAMMLRIVTRNYLILRNILLAFVIIPYLSFTMIFVRFERSQRVNCPNTRCGGILNHAAFLSQCFRSYTADSVAILTVVFTRFIVLLIFYFFNHIAPLLKYFILINYRAIKCKIQTICCHHNEK